MIVHVEAASVVVVEAEDCTRLHVAAPRSVDVDAALRAAGWGRLDPEGAAALAVEALRTHARAAALWAEPDRVAIWDASWEAMLSYAVAKGWVSPDGRTVSAHVERH